MYDKSSTPPQRPLKKLSQEDRSRSYIGYLPLLYKKEGDVLKWHLNDGSSEPKKIKKITKEDRAGAYTHLPGL
ncbi:MAG: hypothetical protein J0I93_08285 [Legionella sp.]|nr:hypothetical protein [Legionella sp.]